MHNRLTELKVSKEAEAGAAMTELARHEPSPPISWGIRLAARLPQRKHDPDEDDPDGRLRRSA